MDLKNKRRIEGIRNKNGGGRVKSEMKNIAKRFQSRNIPLPPPHSFLTREYFLPGGRIWLAVERL